MVGPAPLQSWPVGLGECLVLLKPLLAAGLFVYPLDECTTVVGFEAAVSQRAVTVQIKDKAKIDDTFFGSCSFPDGRACDGSGEGVGDVLMDMEKKNRGRGMGR